MLRKTNCTRDVQPIFNQKMPRPCVQSWSPRKDFYCRVILVRCLLWDFFVLFCLFSNFHLKCRFPVLTWALPRVSRDLYRHPGTPQNILLVCGPFQHPWPCLLLSWLVDASLGYRALHWAPSRCSGPGEGLVGNGELWAPAFLVSLLLGW